MKILIVRFSSIGDIVLTTPVIRGLKKQLDAEVHFCSKKQFQGILTNNPYIDKVHLLNSDFSTLLKSLKEEQFDVIIDLHHNLRSKRIKSALRSKTYTFNKLNIQKFLLTAFKINRLPNRHIVDRYMDTVKELGVKNDHDGLDYFIPEKDEVELNWLPPSHQNGFVAFAIGGQHQTKQLPVKRMIELCDRINRPIILLGGPDDLEKANQIEDFFKPSTNRHLEKSLLEEFHKKTVIFNGCGKFNLNQSASILKQSIAVFTHDTGLMHIAAAFKKEIFSIWGNTVPEFGMYPYQTKFTIFEKKGLKCRPCSKIGYDKCPKGHFKCMNDVVFDFYIPE